MSWKFWEKTPRKKLDQLLHAGSEAMGVGDLEKALACFDQLVRDSVAAKDPTLEAAGLQRRGVIKDMRGDSVGAEQDVRAALALNRAIGSVEGTIRQDLFTLGVILATRGDSLAAEAPFLESARVAGLTDQDAHYRAINSVLIGRMQREDRAGALELLWDVRPGGDGPRWLAGSMLAHMLADLLVEAGRLGDALALLPHSAAAMAYWDSKHSLGSIDDATMQAVWQSTVKTAVVCARGAAAAGRRDETERILQLLERVPGVDGVDELRAELLG